MVGVNFHLLPRSDKIKVKMKEIFLKVQISREIIFRRVVLVILGTIGIYR